MPKNQGRQNTFVHTNLYKISNKYVRNYHARIIILIYCLSQPKYTMLFCILPGQIKALT